MGYEISARELNERLSAPEGPLLLDVRPEADCRRLPVPARPAVETLNLPYLEFIANEPAALDRVRAWIGDRERLLVVVCASGGPSDFVADLLRGEGLPAVCLEGGLAAWVSAAAA